MTLKTVEVLAPGNLPEGYVFDATVDGVIFAVTVPEGGVEEGQPIRVAYPVPSAPILVAATPIVETPSTSSFLQPDGTRVTEIKNTDGTSTVIRETPRIEGGSEYQPLAPTGRFRNGMCDCFEVFCSGRFWMACCCIGCYMGQIMQRFKLNPFGAPGNYQNTCLICTVAFTILIIVSWILTAAFGTNCK
ncbi:hypothetical protein FisN_13Lh017 [Fistulifera solaris]|uniref:Uncharacterized protein n=1 Tax=Fistulifera solaris TaxID=1519565 RepID=A0A1Z5JFN4_FISSO|nr:hypothetical protein FisN_13Lh017 [Fistulifera solaris]|eukprot:GAX12568.1 hypothetical protein FisN_13Lh017 [Fistulifera solaris]